MTFPGSGETKLCLNMIVRNEAPRLKRCLDSVAPFVSAYAILDTGSTDGTPELIREYFKEKGIPGSVGEGRFVDFSQARNDALSYAFVSPYRRRSDMDPALSEHSFTHLLLCDADMQFCADNDGKQGEYNVLKALDSLPGQPGWPAAHAPGFMIPQIMGSIRYQNVRIVRADLIGVGGVRYVGATHEYITLPVHALPKLDALHFHDWADGASHVEKHERDKKLLLADLEKDPNNIRALYYLGQTCSEMGDHAEALSWFERRAAAGGFEEEAWFALWRSAQCYAEIGLEGRAIETALAAYERRPSRKEPIHWLAKRFRERGKNYTAMIFTDAGLGKNTQPAGDMLFVDQEAHGHGFRYELSISGFYTGRAKEAKDASLSLAIDPDVPPYAREQARYNTVHYAPIASDLFSEAKLTPIATGLFSATGDLDSSAHGYAPSNPSILSDGDRLLVNVRRVNYRINEKGWYDNLRADENWIQTQNQIGQWNLDKSGTFQPIEGDAVLCDQAQGAKPSARIRGYEDVRLIGFVTADCLLASATIVDRGILNPKGEDFHPQIAMLQIDNNDSGRWIVKRADVLRDHEPDKVQKNWMPLALTASSLRVSDEQAKANPVHVSFLYSVSPWTILTYAVTPDEAPRFERVETISDMRGLDHLRGSSQLVWVDGIEPWEPEGFGVRWPIGGSGAGFFFVTHEVVLQNNRRTYLHRFAFVEALDRPDTLRLTDPFYFHTKGIEFSAGLTEKDGFFYATFGLNDAEAWMCKIPIEKVWEKLSRVTK